MAPGYLEEDLPAGGQATWWTRAPGFDHFVPIPISLLQFNHCRFRGTTRRLHHTHQTPQAPNLAWAKQCVTRIRTDWLSETPDKEELHI